MKRNEPVEIIKVSNGFLVQPKSLNGRCLENTEDIFVFQSMQSLTDFLDVHFTFRCGNVEVDAPIPARAGGLTREDI